MTDRRDGTLIYYRLADDLLATLLDQGKAVVKGLEGDGLVFAPVPEEALANCPCPRCQGACRTENATDLVEMQAG